jgi:adenosylcobyric acid synthase
MLGQKILDPHKVESNETEVAGLGLLDAVTEFVPEKSTSQVRGQVVSSLGLLAGCTGLDIGGYEIHMGRTSSEERAFRVPGRRRLDYTDAF